MQADEPKRRGFSDDARPNFRVGLKQVGMAARRPFPQDGRENLRPEKIWKLGHERAIYGLR